MKQFQGHALRIGKELARRAPTIEDSIIGWLDVLNRGQDRRRGRHVRAQSRGRKVGDVGRQATVGLIVVGQLIGTAIVMAIMLQPSLAEFQVAYAAMIAFGITLVVSFIVLFRVFLNRGNDD